MVRNDSPVDSTDRDAQPDGSDAGSVDTNASGRDGVRVSRRRVLATCGALSLGPALETGTVAGASDGGPGPDSFAEFKDAVDETLSTAQSIVDRGPYDPTWDSLDDVDPVPEWFRDAKFGLYFHWGLYSVPGFSTEWYPKWMYEPGREGWGDEVYDHHVANYGKPDEFPYQDFAPMFTAENFDAAEWADLFEQAGAKFAGPVAEHHDGWSNWPSNVNPYNAGAMGPQRDLVGELSTAIRDRDMRFVTTFHHGRPAKKREGLEDHYYQGAYDYFPSVVEGFPNRVMYKDLPADLRWDTWFSKLVEAIERYEPDLVWHDSIHNPPESVKLQYLAYNYNRAAAEDRDIAITQKSDALPLSVSVEDYENDRPWQMLDQAWLTDTTLSTGAWCYTTDQEYKSAERVLHVFVDIVSKNGQMLLNLGPRADGTIPQVQQDRLEEIGDWLDTNGEAIYETRPWDVYGEGPHWGEGYTAEDVRYTQSKDGDTVYAITLGWPGAGSFTLNGTYVDDPSNAPSTPPGHGGSPPGKNTSSNDGDAPDDAAPPEDVGPTDVTLLGHGSVPHAVDEHNHVEIDVPSLSAAERPDEKAVVFKLTGFDLQGLTADYKIDSSDIFVKRAEEGLHEITLTVYNLARGESPPTTLRVENASNDAVIAETEIESMPLYGHTEVTVEWDTSAFADGSQQEIRAVVDPDDQVPEQDESNNSATKTVELPVWPVDLVPSPVSVTDMQPGSTAELTVEVENRGTEKADETTVRLSDVTGDESVRIADLALPAVAPDSSAEVRYTWDVSDFEVGTSREVRAVADLDDAQSERDESNNTSSTAVRLLDHVPDGYETYASTDAVFGTWDDNLVISANGEDIWDETDQYGAIYRPDVRADTTTATVKVVSQENTNEWAKAGLMIRNDVTRAGSSSGYAAFMVTPENGFEFEWDSDGDGFVDSAADKGEASYPCWLRLEKSGNTLTGYYSIDGSTWTEVGSADVPKVGDVQDVALFATSHTDSDLGRVEFDQFEVSSQ